MHALCASLMAAALFKLTFITEIVRLLRMDAQFYVSRQGFFAMVLRNTEQSFWGGDIGTKFLGLKSAGRPLRPASFFI